jgi:transcriptional regulator with XRE-family HTH domain
MGLGTNVKRLRAARGWTLETLSELAGVEVGTLSALENRSSSRSKYAPQIARAFGISIETLYGEPTPDQVDPRSADLMAAVDVLRRRMAAMSPSTRKVACEAVVAYLCGEEGMRGVVAFMLTPPATDEEVAKRLPALPGKRGIDPR